MGFDRKKGIQLCNQPESYRKTKLNVATQIILRKII